MLYAALELGAGGDDHKGHTHPPCAAHQQKTFAELSWEPAALLAAEVKEMMQACPLRRI